MNNKTKIIATLGPATHSAAAINRLIKAGASVFRLNFSHGDMADHAELLKNIRSAAAKTGRRVAVIQDLPGPKIRTGEVEGGKINLIEDSLITLTAQKCLGTVEKLTINYSNLVKDVRKGTRILLNDGQQILEVESVGKKDLQARVIVGGFIVSRRGVHIQGRKLSIDAFTRQDRKSIMFGIENEVEYIALSFVQDVADIEAARKILKKYNSSAKIITKIETSSAIKHIDKIIQATDAIMIARGDLAIEMGPEYIPVLQKQIIHKTRMQEKPVIVATQMLESMTNDLIPTRAEASDVSNAVYDGVDAVMLSGETAMGAYPTETVAMMSSIIQATEKIDHLPRMNLSENFSKVVLTPNVIVHAALHAATQAQARAIVVYSETGNTAVLQSATRSDINVVIRSSSEMVLNQSALLFGAIPESEVIHDITNQKQALQSISRFLKKNNLAEKGDRVVAVSGFMFGQPGSSNTLSVIEVS